jgi:hypothetical protein
MPYGLNRGLGVLTQYEYAQCNAQFLRGIFDPFCWQTVAPASTVAPVGAPTGDVLTVPPASGTDAQATVDALTNQQLLDQNALNAGAVQSSWWDELTGGTYATAAGAASGLTSYLPWILGGAGLLVFGMVAFGGGSARRYGR